MIEQQKILIVDDQEKNLFSLASLLHKTGAEIIQVQNGNQALLASLNHDFALAILDVQMPEMDGYELAELLRGAEKTRHLPILFLTAVFSEKHHVFKGYESGAVDFIIKPFDPDILLNKVNVFLDLHRQRQEIQEKEARYRAFVEDQTELICRFLPDGSIVFANPAFGRYFEMPDQEISGSRFSEYAIQKEREGIAGLLKGLTPARPFAKISFLVNTPRRRHRWVEWTLRAIFTPSGKLVEYQAVGRDIHEKKEAQEALQIAHDALEQRVRDRTLELEEANRALEAEILERKEAEEKLKMYTQKLETSNKELQEFAFVASHDLQEPLRKIQVFGDRLGSRFQDQLDAMGIDYLMRMQNAARRMKELINDLLTYSRITTQANPFQQVDLKKVFGDITSDLQVFIEQNNAAVEIGELAAIEADNSQMRQLFQNLVGNGIKFNESGRPVIKISGSYVNGGSSAIIGNNSALYRIQVEDNGIGFEEQYAQQIFAPFQRLHGRNEYEGTGMGLAICRKIVDRHHGRIDVKSAPGRGTTFSIILPVHQHRPASKPD